MVRCVQDSGAVRAAGEWDRVERGKCRYMEAQAALIWAWRSRLEDRTVVAVTEGRLRPKLVISVERDWMRVGDGRGDVERDMVWWRRRVAAMRWAKEEKWLSFEASEVKGRLS